MFDIKKFFSGFNIFNSEKLAKIIFFGILITVGLIIYNRLTQSNQTQKIVVQKGAVASGGKLEIGGQKQEQKNQHWAIGGNIQNDKTVGLSVMYIF